MVPLLSEMRLRQAVQPLTATWQHLPIEPGGSTLPGISFRPPQVTSLGLDMRDTLQTLLAYPFPLLRLGAYWKRIEPEPGLFRTDELDWQIDAAEQAGKHGPSLLTRPGAVNGHQPAFLLCSISVCFCALLRAGNFIPSW